MVPGVCPSERREHRALVEIAVTGRYGDCMTVSDRPVVSRPFEDPAARRSVLYRSLVGSPARTLELGDVREGARPAEASVDLVILHDVLDAKAAEGRGPLREFLRGIGSLVAPGGAIAGCIARRHTAVVRAALGSAGLDAVRLFALSPDRSGPRSAVSLEARAWRHFALRELNGRRSELGTLGYAARWLLATTGLGRHLVADVCFVASRK
jgi:hypothetical protein